MATTSSLLGRGLGLVLVEFKYEYQGRDGELVSIKPNERYILLAKTNDHWWHVRSDYSSKPFYIPAKYVKELPPDFPSPLDFGDPTSSDPVPLPVSVAVPVAVPVPKPLEEPGGVRAKPGDEVMIRLKPDTSTAYRKAENRMSTFGVPLDFSDLMPLFLPAQQHPSCVPPGGLAEAGTTASSETTNKADGVLGKKQDDQRDPVKPQVPSFSPADPLVVPRPQTQAIPVETPVVPTDHLHSDPQSIASAVTGPKDHRDVSTGSDEEELVAEDDSSEQESNSIDDPKEEDSNHIYESIQDLNLDLEALVGKRLSPGPPPPEPAPDPPCPKDVTSPGSDSPIYANVSNPKKALTSHPSSCQISLPSSLTPVPAPAISDHTPSSSVSSSGMISPASPLCPQDGWQVHTDQDSGKQFFYHPVSRRTTWSNPMVSPSSAAGDTDAATDWEEGPLPPASSSAQSSGVWEQLVDEVSGRFYYYNPDSGATSWTEPEPLPPSPPPGSTDSRKPDSGPPPLPQEDYPVDGPSDDGVFTTDFQKHVIPRAQLDLRDGASWRLQELPQLPQRLTGNGVPEVGGGLPKRPWRHSVAEDTLVSRRNISNTEGRTQSRDTPQSSDRFRLKRNLSNRSTDSHPPHDHLLEKAGIINKTKVADNGKKIRKNWGQSWTVLHGGILTFHRDPKSAPAGTANKSSQIVPEYTVELRGASVNWASKDKSSKKNVLELKTRQGCEYLMQYDTESIISDWLKAMQDTIRQLEQDHLSDDEDDAASDKEDKDRKRTPSRTSSGVESEQRRVRTKLRRFLQRRPTLQSVKERGYIRDNVFGCHLDTLCHRENTTIPRFVEKCIRAVERRGLDVDGIYRVSGNLAVIQKLRHKADHEEQLDLEDGQWEEIHVITGALKLFLRELPEPLFPFSCFEKFIAAIQVPDHSLRVSYMKDLVCSLPLPNHDTMELLFKHLRKVIEHKDSNRMSVQSVAIVFGPTLLRPQTESANMTIHMVFQSQIVELMLNRYQTIFSQG